MLPEEAARFFGSRKLDHSGWTFHFPTRAHFQNGGRHKLYILAKFEIHIASKSNELWPYFDSQSN